MIRRLFKAPRVIVLVATIGVAAALRRRSRSRSPTTEPGRCRPQFPLPFSGEWHRRSSTSTCHARAKLLVLIVVPLITLGLWWLLGHTAFGDAVRASATNADLARLTGISPKLVSTAVWTIAGFLSTVVGDPPDRERRRVDRPRPHRARHAAARAWPPR